jgi:hypothetical protein
MRLAFSPHFRRSYRKAPPAVRQARVNDAWRFAGHM